MAQGMGGPSGARSGGFLGSLKDALAAASREDQPAAAPEKHEPTARVAAPPPLPAKPAPSEAKPVESEPAQQSRREDKDAAALPLPSAADAAREVKAQASLRAMERPADRPGDRHVEADAAPTTRVLRAAAVPQPAKPAEDPARTQLVRGRQPLKRGEFSQDPVVGWLVVVGGPGLGNYRPIFEGNNTVGRASSNRIPLDFGDAAISSEEQAYIRYDAADRSFLFVPNLAKTNVVSVNDRRPTGAVVLENMDVIVMGRTQLVFVPFCGPEFDWSEITEAKG